MTEFSVKHNDQASYPIGITPVAGGVHFGLVSGGKKIALLLFGPDGETLIGRFAFAKEECLGAVWNLTVLGNFSQIRYCYEIDGVRTADPYGRRIYGRETWGQAVLAKELTGGFPAAGYDWEEDRPPGLPDEECVIYRLHPRGFTKHPSARVKARGTFAGIGEKIPYLKELGITTVELMPAIEFAEVMTGPGAAPSGRLNYWGFIPGFYFAPKASYCAGKKPPETEFKDLVKALHKAGMELVMGMYFDGKERDTLVLDVLRFWVREYHVDGFHLIGFIPRQLVAQDPYLSGVKLWADSWADVSLPVPARPNLAEYRDDFLIDMRRFLKGDEDQISNVIFRTKYNPEKYAVINYLANVNGFTLMDNVSYDIKHNEDNGEDNRDGSDCNYSWNCGAEGPSRKKKVLQMRRQQIRNALLLVFLSQGIPLLLAGDEFGNSQQGNNNAYCQDNEISWLNWNQVKSNRDLYGFARDLIAFRKAHPIFRLPKQPRVMDYLTYGQPDVSYHGEKAWYPEFEPFRRQLGILYNGKYAKKPDGSPDDYFFVVYNMHWEAHEFAIPNLPKPLKWHRAIDTGNCDAGILAAEVLKDQKKLTAAGRTIVVLIGK